jgi:hypothetical protein
MPWRLSSLWTPEKALSNRAYNGINVVNPWVAAEASECDDGRRCVARAAATDRL